MSRAALRATRRSLRFRAVVALGLVAGFYLLAFGIVAAVGALLLWSISGGHFRASLIPLALAAVAILRGVLYLDRGAETAPPISVEVRPEEEPRLWDEVHALADAVRAPRPDVIYLVHDVNAFVHQEARLMGLRPGRTVLGVGMGLLAVLRAGELRAVLGHELGHLGGGDTRLGPAVYRVRRSLLRTVERLGEGLLAKLFAAYFRLFMRLTMSVSRRQELAADVGAVRLGGRDAAARALQRVAVAGGVFDFLIEEYAAPLWRSGRWPADLYGGLRRLLDEPARADQLARLREALLAAPTGEWDSHPALGERLRSIATLRGGPPGADEPPGRSLLRDPGATERRLAELLSAAATDGRARTAVGWLQAAEEVYGPALERQAERLASAGMALGGRWRRPGLDQALDLLAAGQGVAVARRLADLDELPPAEREGAAAEVLAHHLRAAVSSELVRHHGGRWAPSWAELVEVEGWHGQVDELVQAALQGPDGVAALRSALRLEPVGA